MKLLLVILALGVGASDVSAAQSAPGEPIAPRDAWSPAAVGRATVNDAAPPYGRRYERGGQLSSWLQTAGEVLMLGAIVARETQRRCKGLPDNDQHQCKVIDEVFVGGVALYLASYGFSWRPVKGAASGARIGHLFLTALATLSFRR